MEERTARCVNILADFCGKRDVPELSAANLQKLIGTKQADVMVLFGGSILQGGKVLAEAMKNEVARVYGIVGGEGHTTQSLRDTMHAEFPQIETCGKAEAEVFSAYLHEVWGLTPDFLECRSTNCGNNITNLLQLLKERQIPCKSIILTQDRTMQRRMEAGLRKYAGEEIAVVNYPAYETDVVFREGKLSCEREIRGMWDVERYITLLMGEIPRLTDDENGYGPRGKGFIAHVDVPKEVREAFSFLREQYPNLVRGANPAYAG